MLSRMSAVAFAGLLVLSAATYLVALAAPQETSDALVDTVLRGIDHRRGLVTSARCIMILETTASEPYRLQYQEQLRQACQKHGLPVPNVASRDVACASFAYDDEQYVWHLGLATESGWNWWGIGYHGEPMPEGIPPPTLASLCKGGAGDSTKTYTYDATTMSCIVSDVGPEQEPPPIGQEPPPIGLFKLLFVDMIDRASLNVVRESRVVSMVGSSEYLGHECFVIAATGRHDPPRSMWRLWVSKAHFMVLRMEHIEVDAGQLASASSQTVSGLLEAAPGVWLPTGVRVDHMCSIDGQFTWDWTKHFELHDVSINEELQLTPADYLFRPSFRWRDQTSHEELWRGGRYLGNQTAHAVEAQCDPGLVEAVAHADDLVAWMSRPAK